MYYDSPTENGTPYYIPIVVKDKQFLIGYLQGMNDGKDLVCDVLRYIDIKANFDITDVMLSSSRFNDMLENGKRESEMNADELREYLFGIVKHTSAKSSSNSVENNINYDSVLQVECICGLGYYSWATYEDIPDKNFKCTNCGKTLIHYCNHYDYEYTFQEGEVHDRQKN